ncbi:hypothetical protein DFR64_1258 [Pelolinea submarina]|uniref:Bacterial Ig-like domain-containing protein n=1 Tax=Pelolinea submarina TaxID=913107 RepID=A0A3E0AI96_9CHLR|nr:hypothetical protein DFR64_1258 [Pelolinea submarina]
MDRCLKTPLLLSLALLTIFTGSAFTLQKKVGRDRNPPTVVLSMPAPTGNNGWYNQPVQVFVKAYDGGSGLADVQVSLGGGTWYKRSLTIRKDGTYYVIGKAVDKAGNMATATQLIKVDLTPPEVDFNIPQVNGQPDWYVTPVSLALNGSDALSGVYKTTLSAQGTFEMIDDGLLDRRESTAGVQTANQILVAGKELNSTSAYIKVTKSGDYLVSGYVEDIAGNRTPVETRVVLDLDAPLVEFTSPDQYYGNIELSGPISEMNSGVAGVWIDSGKGWKRANVKDSSWSYLWATEGLKDDDYIILARVMDKAGNLSNSSTKVTVVNHFWPLAAIYGILISLGLVAMYDPRRRALMELTLMTARYAHMDNSARHLERKKYD